MNLASHPKFSRENNLLKNKGRLRMRFDSALKQLILHNFGTEGGHSGVKKTLTRIWRAFYWEKKNKEWCLFFCGSLWQLPKEQTQKYFIFRIASVPTHSRANLDWNLYGFHIRWCIAEGDQVLRGVGSLESMKLGKTGGTGQPPPVDWIRPVDCPARLN